MSSYELKSKIYFKLFTEQFEDIPTRIYQFSKLGKDLNKVFSSSTIKAIVENSYLPKTKEKIETRKRLEHNNQIINIFGDHQVDQNIIR